MNLLTATSQSPGFLQPALEPEVRRRLWLQIVIVLALAVVPDVCNALASLTEELPSQLSITAQSAWLIVRSVSVIAAILSLLTLAGERPSDIGFGSVIKMDFALTLLVIGLSLGTYMSVGYIVYGVFGEGKEFDQPHPETFMEWYWFVISHVANGAAEELAIWGLLYTRLRRLWHRHELLAMVVPAAAFASYHLYQGVSPAIMIFVFGMTHAIMYRASGRLWPLVIAHAATNIYYQSASAT